ncbi:MAG: nucleoside hydrolase [Oscillospiraceae bacterium]
MNRIPVVIDSALNADEILGLLLAKKSDMLDIKALCTIACTKDSGALVRAQRLAAALEWDIEPVPGAEKNLYRSARELKPVFDFDETLLPERTISDKAACPAWEVIYSEAKKSGGQLVLIALGPLTNLAIALAVHQDIEPMIKCVIAAGGGIIGGDATMCAEYNFYADPEAAQKVIKSRIPVYLCPADMGSRAYLTANELEDIAQCGSAESKLFSKIGLANLEKGLRFSDKKGYPSKAAAAVMFAIDGSLFTSDECFLGVETMSREAYGKTVTDVYSDKQYEHGNFILLDCDREGFTAKIEELLI